MPGLARRGLCFVIALCLFATVSMLAVSHGVAATSVVYTGPDVFLMGMLILFVISLPINMFWYFLGILILMSRDGLRFTRPTASVGRKLRRKVVGAVVCVTLVSALAGMLGVESEPQWMKAEAGVFAVELAVVAASTALFSYTILRLRAVPSVLMAVGMAAVYAVHWVVMLTVYYDEAGSENPAPAVVAYVLTCTILAVLVATRAKMKGSDETKCNDPPHWADAESR